MSQIQKLSVKHETIMDFLMAHPAIRLGDVASHFGVTQPWLSQVIHSDVFQSRLKEKKDVAFHHTVLPLREKMTALAHMSIDKLMEQVPLQTDASVVNKVAENVLDRLGFGSKAVPTGLQVNAQNVQVNVLRSELEEARDMMLKVNGAKALGVSSGGTPEEIQPKSIPHLGEAGGEVAVAVPAEGDERQGEVGAAV